MERVEKFTKARGALLVDYQLIDVKVVNFQFVKNFITTQPLA